MVPSYFKKKLQRQQEVNFSDSFVIQISFQALRLI